MYHEEEYGLPAEMKSEPKIQIREYQSVFMQFHLLFGRLGLH
jgi:hypothetical protein